MTTTILVLDSFGMGALPDADSYGDGGANTALHICETVKIPGWKNLQRWGLGNAGKLLGYELPGCLPVDRPEASFGVMAEVSPGKDTTTGHWEMAGIQLKKAFPVFSPDYPSFPAELVEVFERETGYGIIGNCAASGTEIIQELGDEHRRTGKLIAYTSADSVFQIASHEEVTDLDELYRVCEIARKLCDSYQVGRVIARPFTGVSGNYTRTSARHDYSIALPGKTFLDYLCEAGVETVGIGKIGSIFNEQGIVTSYHDAGNPACLDRTLKVLEEDTDTIDRSIFVNLVDTDMIYGHRRDPEGYAASIRATDEILPEIVERMADGDALFITGDHGCDPTYRGTDHTREYVPLLLFWKGRSCRNLGIRTTFSDLGSTVLRMHGVEGDLCGRPIKE